MSHQPPLTLGWYEDLDDLLDQARRAAHLPPGAFMVWFEAERRSIGLSLRAIAIDADMREDRLVEILHGSRAASLHEQRRIVHVLLGARL